MSLNKFSLGLGTVCILLSTVSLAELPTCPMTLPPRDLVLTNPPEGWQSGPTTTLLHLTSVGFNSGPIQERAVLIPYEVKTQKNKTVVIWNFDSRYIFPKGLWINCDYNHGVVSLGKPINLAKQPTECTASYTKVKKTEDIKVQCK